MSSTSMKARLWIASGAVQLFVLALGGFSIYNVSSIGKAIDPITQDSMPKTALISSMRGLFREIRIQVRSLGLENLHQDKVQSYEKATLAAAGEYIAALEALRKLPQSPEEKVLLTQIGQDWDVFLNLGKEILGLSQAGNVKNKARLVEIFNGACPEAAGKVYEAMEAYEKHVIGVKSQRLVLAESRRTLGNQVQIIALVLLQLLAFAAVFIVTRSVSRELGDISVRLTEVSSDNSAASKELIGTAAGLSAAANEQAAAVQESVASISEMRSMVGQTYTHVEECSRLSADVKDKTRDGREIMENMVEKMESVQQANSQLESLTKIIEQVTSKTQIINDIVFKTQLLSFNASIEAARAGQHGRGFAVVAEEVGNLAQMSGTAAREIQQLLQDSQRHIGDIVSSVKDRVGEGRDVSSEALDRFSEIAVAVEAIAQKVESIRLASSEQMLGIEQTMKAMNQMDEGSTSTSGTAKDTAHLAERLRERSQQLAQLIAQVRKLVGVHDPVDVVSSQPTPPPRVGKSQNPPRTHRSAA